MTAPERSATHPRGGRQAGLLGPLLAGLLFVAGAAPPPAAAVPSEPAGGAAPAPETVGAWAETVWTRLAGARERLHQLRVVRDLAAGRLTAVEAEVAELRAAWRATGADLRRQRGEVDALDRRVGLLAGRLEMVEDAARRLHELTGHALVELTLEGHRAEEPPDPRTTARLRALGATLLSGWRESEARAAALRHRQEALAARRAEAAARLAATLRRADELRDRLADRARRHLLVRVSVEDASARAAAAAEEVGALLAELGRSEPSGPTRAIAAVAGRGAGAAAVACTPEPLAPIAGPVVARFGQAAAGPRDRGIVIRAAPGQPVGAPAGGRVVFAGPFRSYGLLLIIDHGDGYHSLLSGMTRLRVGVNQWVRAGEPVGSFDDLGETGPQLFVELRRNGRPVNPLPWLAASDSKVRG